MLFGFPHVALVGPVPLGAPGESGLGLRLAGRAEAPAILAHYRGLPAGDLNRRFCGAVSDTALQRHVRASPRAAASC